MGKMDSIRSVMGIVDEFVGLTRLNLNKQKITVIVGSIEESLAAIWANELNLKLSPLPVKYLASPSARAD